MGYGELGLRLTCILLSIICYQYHDDEAEKSILNLFGDAL